MDAYRMRQHGLCTKLRVADGGCQMLAMRRLQQDAVVMLAFAGSMSVADTHMTHCQQLQRISLF